MRKILALLAFWLATLISLLFFECQSAHAAGVFETVYQSTGGQQTCSSGSGCGVYVGSITVDNLRINNAVTGAGAVFTSTAPSFFTERNVGGNVNDVSGDGTLVVLVFDTPIYDNFSGISGATYTIPSGWGGIWHFDTCVAWNASSSHDGGFILTVLYGGSSATSSILRSRNSIGTNQPDLGACVSADYTISALDKIAVRSSVVGASGGGARDCDYLAGAGPAVTYFSGHFVNH